MKHLEGQAAIDRIRWNLQHKSDLLGRVVFRDSDLMTLRYILGIAERTIRAEAKPPTDRVQGSTISEDVMRRETPAPATKMNCHLCGGPGPLNGRNVCYECHESHGKYEGAE